jgi:hypothetical protein
VSVGCTIKKPSQIDAGRTEQLRASTPALEIKHIADEWRPSSRGATIDQAAKRLKVERGRDN